MKCCTKFNEEKCLKGYIMLPCFKIRVCNNCNEVEMICNNFLCKIFELFLSPFWTGKIVIYEELEKKEKNND